MGSGRARVADLTYVKPNSRFVWKRSIHLERLCTEKIGILRGFLFPFPLEPLQYNTDHFVSRIRTQDPIVGIPITERQKRVARSGCGSALMESNRRNAGTATRR